MQESEQKGAHRLSTKLVPPCVQVPYVVMTSTRGPDHGLNQLYA